MTPLGRRGLLTGLPALAAAGLVPELEPLIHAETRAQVRERMQAFISRSVEESLRPLVTKPMTSAVRAGMLERACFTIEIAEKTTIRPSSSEPDHQS